MITFLVGGEIKWFPAKISVILYWFYDNAQFYWNYNLNLFCVDNGKYSLREDSMA